MLHCNSSLADASLSFIRAWIAEAPPVSKVLAAYMEISNNTDKIITIISIESNDFSRIEFHRTVHENDIAKMQHQKNLSIPASGSLKLEPGSYHLMLFNPARKLRSGDHSVFTIKTSNDKSYQLTVDVKKSNIDHNHH